MIWTFLEFLFSFWTLVLAMVGGHVPTGYFYYLNKGFVVLLGVGMCEIGIGVRLGIKISWEVDIIGHDFSLFHRITFWD